eukprot:Clim_evm65s243 gene=Clim_evmTU65s243
MKGSPIRIGQDHRGLSGDSYRVRYGPMLMICAMVALTLLVLSHFFISSRDPAGTVVLNPRVEGEPPAEKHPLGDGKNKKYPPPEVSSQEFIGHPLPYDDEQYQKWEGRSMNMTMTNEHPWTQYLNAKDEGFRNWLPDFSYAGYHYNTIPIPNHRVWDHKTYRVSWYGGHPNDDEFDDEAIQKAIHEAEKSCGGIITFEAGTYLISPTSKLSDYIQVNMGNTIFLGMGSDPETGTIIKQVSAKAMQAFHVIQVGPAHKSYDNKRIAKVIADVPRESFWIPVDDVSKFYEWQTVVLENTEKDYWKHEYKGMEMPNRWARMHESGLEIYEPHQIEKIDYGRKMVKFLEPIRHDILVEYEFTIRDNPMIEEVGFQGIAFHGGYDWNNVPQDFRHHQGGEIGEIHDWGWQMVRFDQCLNCWMRDVSFKNLNGGLYLDHNMGFTLENAVWSGKATHHSLQNRRSYGSFFKNLYMNTTMEHGPTTCHLAVGTVYYNLTMQEGMPIDFHAGNPRTTLYDYTTGGQFEGSGGPYKAFPNHGHMLVFWNLLHRAWSPYLMSERINFWFNPKHPEGPYTRHIFAKPVVIGLEGDPVGMYKNTTLFTYSLDEFVKPDSLFYAQLNERGPTKLKPRLKKQDYCDQDLRTRVKKYLFEGHHD